MEVNRKLQTWKCSFELRQLAKISLVLYMKARSVRGIEAKNILIWNVDVSFEAEFEYVIIADYFVVLKRV